MSSRLYMMDNDGESTYKVLNRILGIHEYLNKQRAPNLSLLADKFLVSTKTIQRDISFMKKEMNLPITYSREYGGYRYTEEVIDMPVMKLSRQELFALLIARSSIEQYQGSAFENPLKSFFKKLLVHLASLDLSHMEEVNNFVSYLPNGVNTAKYETLDILGQACRDRRTIEVNYSAASTGKKKKRTLYPRHLINYGGNWYLIATHPQSGEAACFHLARMEGQIKLGREFKYTQKFDLREARKYSFGAFIGKETYNVKLHFDEVAAPFILEKEWNSSQITKSRKDGGVDFSITVCDLIEIKAWILSWGEHAKVIGPKELAEDIKEELDKMVKKYQ